MKEADLNTKYSVTDRVPQFSHTFLFLQGYTEDRSEASVTASVGTAA